MKKILLIYTMCLLLIANAFGYGGVKVIEFNTPVWWSSYDIEEALQNAGLINSANAAFDVRVTSQRILAELLKKDDFSLQDATKVCLDKCNMSDFLKTGQGTSKRKCPEICKDFAIKLVEANELVIEKGTIEYLSGDRIKVWSKDKNFYAIIYENKDKWNIDVIEKGKIFVPSNYSNICSQKSFSAAKALVDVVVFEENTDKPIALLSIVGEDSAMGTEQYCTIPKYVDWEFSLDSMRDYEPNDLQYRKIN